MTFPGTWRLSLFSALCGCMPAQTGLIGTPIEGYNHTSAAIHHFSVNRNGGPDIGPYGGGGKQNCCIGMPVQWRPGLKVLVEWEKDPAPHAYGRWPERRHTDEWRARMSAHRAGYSRHSVWAEVASYERLGVVDVHFLPCDQVAVSAGVMLPGKPGYPFGFPRRMEAPSPCPAN